MKKFILLFVFLLTCVSFYLPLSVKAYDIMSTLNNIYGISVVNHSDLEDASKLVNSNGGDWGYVTIVITEDNRDKLVWQKFLDDCRRLHLIPIIRVATRFENGNWQIPKAENIDSWVNFFNSLNWVIENRYIIIGNEPNHAKEWGGSINPSDYAKYLKLFSERLHNANKDYYVLNAGFDQDAPNSKGTMDEKKYIELMIKDVPDVFNFIDGFVSHSYPNPAFSGSVNDSGRRSIKGYEWELGLIKSDLPAGRQDLPVFITETGWIRSKKNSESEVANSLKSAYENVWMKDKKIVAVTPFILNYQDDPFYDFSWKKSNTEFFTVYNEIQNIQKVKGEPKQKIAGEVVFNFLNPLMIRNSEQKGFSIVRNTGQAIWTQSDSNVVNNSDNEIKISNTKFNPILPYTTGLVTYTLKSPDSASILDVKLGFYVSGERIGDSFNGKIISF